LNFLMFEESSSCFVFCIQSQISIGRC